MTMMETLWNTSVTIARLWPRNRERRYIGADGHDRPGGKRDAAREPDQHHQRNANQHRYDGHRNDILRIAVEPKPYGRAENNEQGRSEGRKVRPAVRHCARTFRETFPADAT